MMKVPRSFSCLWDTAAHPHNAAAKPSAVYANGDMDNILYGIIPIMHVSLP